PQESLPPPARQPAPGGEPRPADPHPQEQLGDTGARRAVADLRGRPAGRGHEQGDGGGRGRDQAGQDHAAPGRDLAPERVPAPAADGANLAAAFGARTLDLSRGLFITFEGVEGSGKTTQAELLAQALASRDAIVVREPGGTELGERMREVLLFGAMEIDPEAEM